LEEEKERVIKKWIMINIRENVNKERILHKRRRIIKIINIKKLCKLFILEERSIKNGIHKRVKKFNKIIKGIIKKEI